MNHHDQVGPLVGGKSPSKTNRQHVRIEQVTRGFDDRVAFAAPTTTLATDPASDERQQQVLFTSDWPRIQFGRGCPANSRIVGASAVWSVVKATLRSSCWPAVRIMSGTWMTGRVR